MSKRQRFHITLPGGEQIWITGNTISEAFENGLKKVGGGENKPLRTTPTLKNYAEEWWTLYKLPKLKHTTLRTYRNLLDKHILPYTNKMARTGIILRHGLEALPEEKGLLRVAQKPLVVAPIKLFHLPMLPEKSFHPKV